MLCSSISASFGNSQIRQVAAISQASVFVCPALEHSVDITVSGNEPVWPEGNAALVEALLNMVFGRLENRGASDHHLEFASHSTDARQNTFTDFADESDGES